MVHATTPLSAVFLRDCAQGTFHFIDKACASCCFGPGVRTTNGVVAKYDQSPGQNSLPDGV